MAFEKTLKEYTGEKLNKRSKCDLPGNQFDHTFDNTQWTKAKINATISIMHFLRQAIWGDIWKRTVEKMSGEQVYYNHLRPAILEDTRANKTVPQLNWRTTNKKSGPGGPPDFSCWMCGNLHFVKEVHIEGGKHFDQNCWNTFDQNCWNTLIKIVECYM